MTNSTTYSTSRVVRYLTAITVAAGVWLLTPQAWAQNCLTPDERRECLVCVKKRKACQRQALSLAGRVDALTEQHTALRHTLDATELELHDTRQALDDRPGWPWVLGGAAAGIVVGGLAVLVAGWSL